MGGAGALTSAGTSSSTAGASASSGGAPGGSGAAGSGGSDCIIRVATTGSDSHGGSDWSRALRTVQGGLDAASAMIDPGICSAVEVWVAAGTYQPTADADRNATFQLVANVALRGGFDGTESVRTDRDLAANVTILTGDIGVPDDASDNSYHVVTGVTGATLDGFTITGGNANGSWHNGTSFGGGMKNSNSSPLVTHCTFTNNSASGQGGGMFNEYHSSPTVTDCAFTGNVGSGMGNSFSSPLVTNCTFTGNVASSGGGMWNYGSSPTVTNCTFARNDATSGGGIYSMANDDPPLVAVTNCTFTGNSSVTGGAMYNQDSLPTLTNCILWGDAARESDDEIHDALADLPTTVSHSIIQGGYPLGTNVIDVDPLFVDDSSGDVRLQAGSPAIDAGNGCASHVALTDQPGNPRWDIADVADAVDGLDVGAFEYQGTAEIDTLVSAFDCP